MKKEKIYLLPGFMCDDRLWGKLHTLLEEYELIHIPLPLSNNFDDVIKELDKVFKDDDQLNLLGFSLGGYTASYYTINNPDRVKRLFLVSSTAGITEPSHIKRRHEKLNYIKQNGFKELTYDQAKKFLEEQNKENTELVHTLKDMFNDLGFSHYTTHLELSLYRKNLIEHISSLDIPVHLFHSLEDKLLNHGFVSDLRDKELEHIKINTREGTSHNIPLEDDILLAKHIKEWMQA